MFTTQSCFMLSQNGVDHGLHAQLPTASLDDHCLVKVNTLYYMPRGIAGAPRNCSVPAKLVEKGGYIALELPLVTGLGREPGLRYENKQTNMSHLSLCRMSIFCLSFYCL